MAGVALRGGRPIVIRYFRLTAMRGAALAELQALHAFGTLGVNTKTDAQEAIAKVAVYKRDEAALDAAATRISGATARAFAWAERPSVRAIVRGEEWTGRAPLPDGRTAPPR